MASFRLPKIDDLKSTVADQQNEKRRRISTGSMHSGRSGSLEPSPPTIDKARPATVRRTLKRSMSVPGLPLSVSDRSSLQDTHAQRGTNNPRGVGISRLENEHLLENKRRDIRVRAEREFRAVSARVSDFCTRAAAASVDLRDDRLIDTVDCMEDANIAAERLFLNNTTLRKPRRSGFMPNIYQSPTGTLAHPQQELQPDHGHDASHSLPGRDLDDEEAANEMVERISRWLEDVERLKREPCEDLAAGVSLIALT
ncbi:uncharacterized protein LOC110977068 [Acanthaster planci]|uniref:Uncharacterized protein LOC110977068 n=1 Tax=Acanthaster planci TaxID=133434 RepID=A0A8B7Y3W0_ACAPL|nr:uncharacterized protein LOC110977068 [Acanthaster planci]XP_022086562.1 uncharacterized protein LOC110977068 [Acanthaster planci]